MTALLMAVGIPLAFALAMNLLFGTDNIFIRLLDEVFENYE